MLLLAVVHAMIMDEAGAHHTTFHGQARRCSSRFYSYFISNSYYKSCF